jgi:hypothetical protein
MTRDPVTALSEGRLMVVRALLVRNHRLPPVRDKEGRLTVARRVVNENCRYPLTCVSSEVVTAVATVNVISRSVEKLVQTRKSDTSAKHGSTMQPGQGFKVVHPRSDVAVGAVDSYSVVALHVVVVMHTRFDVVVGAVDSYSVVALHVVVVEQTRFDVMVGAMDSY